jgi:hypothetical protein
MRITMVIPATEGCLAAALDGLVQLNVELMSRSQVPPLYGAGVVYRREPDGQDDWKHCERVFRDRCGDCEDLAAYRAAELRVQLGEPAEAIPVRAGRTHSGGELWHAVVRRADGTIEDPSRALGMGKHHERW